MIARTKSKLKLQLEQEHEQDSLDLINKNLERGFSSTFYRDLNVVENRVKRIKRPEVKFCAMCDGKLRSNNTVHRKSVMVLSLPGINPIPLPHNLNYCRICYNKYFNR